MLDQRRTVCSCGTPEEHFHQQVITKRQRKGWRLFQPASKFTPATSRQFIDLLTSPLGLNLLDLNHPILLQLLEAGINTTKPQGRKHTQTTAFGFYLHIVDGTGHEA